MTGGGLFERAEACLQCDDVEEKLTLARQLRVAFDADQLRIERTARQPESVKAGRPVRPRLVAPAKLARRRLGSIEGRAALIHAVAHIEFNAINLACDAVYRFRDMPDAYYADWTRVAAEEAYHFTLLRDRLRELGYAYGDFPAHAGLWDLAVQTAGDPLRRMALVPRVMEARGLDVTPGMMARFVKAGDQATADILAIILRDEVGHVEAGSRWFRFLCEQRGLEPEATYFDLLDAHFRGEIRCPLHRTARLQAGFSEAELERLETLCNKG